MPLVYATAAEYASWSPDPAPADIEQRLARASAAVRRATLTAVYDVTPAGLPSDPEMVATFREATFEQVAYWLTTGDQQGAAGQWQSVSLGRASMSRAAGSGGRTARERLAPLAETVLANAGLIGGPIQDC